jgi:glutamine synthetase
MIALNSAVARQLVKFKKEVDLIMKKGRNKDEAIFQVLKKAIIDSENVLFEGDNYSEEWQKEAQRRKLSNIESVPESISKYLTSGSRDVLIVSGIFTDKELESRVEVEYEKFTKKVQIESRVLADLALNHIVPTGIKYMSSLLENMRGIKEIFDDKEYKKLAVPSKEAVVVISDYITMIKRLVFEMVEERKKANVIEDAYKKALAYEKQVKPYLESIRQRIDKLELIVDDEIWPLPKYRELLFTH